MQSWFSHRKEKFLKESESLLQENQAFKKELENLKFIINRLTLGSKKFQIILSNQRTIFTKLALISILLINKNFQKNSL